MDLYIGPRRYLHTCESPAMYLHLFSDMYNVQRTVVSHRIYPIF